MKDFGMLFVWFVCGLVWGICGTIIATVVLK